MQTKTYPYWIIKDEMWDLWVDLDLGREMTDVKADRARFETLNEARVEARNHPHSRVIRVDRRKETEEPAEDENPSIIYMIQDYDNEDLYWAHDTEEWIPLEEEPPQYETKEEGLAAIGVLSSKFGLLGRLVQEKVYSDNSRGEVVPVFNDSTSDEVVPGMVYIFRSYPARPFIVVDMPDGEIRAVDGNGDSITYGTVQEWLDDDEVRVVHDPRDFE